MKNDQSLLNLHEMNTSELISTSGGGEADDLSYVLTYGALGTNPVYWAIRYSGWLLKALT
jgi:hypothetical protein